MRKGLQAIAALALILPGAAATQRGPPGAQDYQAPRHSAASPLITGASPARAHGRRADAGMQVEQDRSPADALAEHRKLDRALQGLAGQRAGTVDAYVVSIALDSDPVFGREARVAADVLSHRYGAAGRTIVLAGSDGSAPSALPRGSPATLAVTFARIAELMDRNEDALILYTTSHGTPFGLYYHDADNGFGAISPTGCAPMLDGLGLRNRLLIVSACYSGVFVPVLRSPTTAIVTAASAERTSFGCAADNDWTFFGDAMINHALRRPQPLAAAFVEAESLVINWEARVRTTPSHPQINVGADADRWLDALERAHAAGRDPPVGRPAIETTPGRDAGPLTAPARGKSLPFRRALHRDDEDIARGDRRMVNEDRDQDLGLGPGAVPVIIEVTRSDVVNNPVVRIERGRALDERIRVQRAQRLLVPVVGEFDPVLADDEIADQGVSGPARRVFFELERVGAAIAEDDVRAAAAVEEVGAVIAEHVIGRARCR